MGTFLFIAAISIGAGLLYRNQFSKNDSNRALSLVAHQARTLAQRITKVDKRPVTLDTLLGTLNFSCNTHPSLQLEPSLVTIPFVNDIKYGELVAGEGLAKMRVEMSDKPTQDALEKMVEYFLGDLEKLEQLSGLKMLLCPICFDVLKREDLDDEYSCPEHGNLYLSGAVEYLLRGEDLSPATLKKLSLAPSTVACPNCSGAMNEVSLNSSNVDACLSCGAIWCDLLEELSPQLFMS